MDKTTKMNNFLPDSVPPWLKRCLVLVILSASVTGFAQQPMFTKVYYDAQGSAQAYSTVEGPDHAFYIAGQKDLLGLAMKTDSAGTIEWALKVGSFIGSFYDLVLTNDSGIVFAGSAYNPVNPTTDLLLLKVTPDGDTVWTRTLDLGNDDFLSSIKLTPDGGFILSCKSGVGTAVIRLDPDGEMIWSRAFAIANASMAVFSVTPSTDGEYYVIGSTDGYPMGNGDMFLGRLEADGSCSRAWVLSTLGASFGLDVAVQPDGLMCLVESLAGLGLMKTDLFGNPQWYRSYNLFFNYNWNYGPVPNLRQTADGDFIFLDGSGYGPGYGVKVNPAGDAVLRANVFLNTADITETHDGGYLFTGNGPILGVEMAGTDAPQIGIIKTDSMFTSTGCLWPETAWFDEVSFLKDTFAVYNASPGTLFKMPYDIQDANLSTDTGCVAFLGAVNECNRNEFSLDVYPNPTSGMINIGIHPETSEKINRIEIFNSSGHQIISSSDRSTQIDLMPFPPGLYLLRAETTSGTLTKRIVLIN
jgi:hypothetical protein